MILLLILCYYQRINTNYDVYIINLDRSQDRLKKIKQLCNKANVNFTRFSAIDGKKIKKNIKRKGEYACKLSHIEIWKNFKKNNQQNCIIFEDDVIIPADFWYKLDTKMKSVPNDWDLIYLGGSHIYGDQINSNVLKPHVFTKKPERVYNVGLFAYIINKNSVNKLLKYTNGKNTKPIDDQVRNLHNKLNLYYIYPSIIKHDYNFDSERRIIDFNDKKYNKNVEKTGNNITIMNK